MSEKFEVLDIDNNKISSGTFDECIDFIIEQYSEEIEFNTMCTIVTKTNGEVVGMIKHKDADIRYT